MLLAVLAAGVTAIRIGGTVHFQDERDYLALARSLAGGHGFVLATNSPADPPPGLAYRPPGYPFLLAPVAAVSGGSVLAMRFVGVGALGVAAWLGYLLGRRALSPGAGAAAALGIACYPLFVYTAATLYPQLPALALLLGFVECAWRTAESGRPRWVVGAGLTAGLLVLTVPVLGVTVPLTVGWLAWRRRRTPESRAAQRIRYRALAAVLLLAVAVPGCWTVRNAFVLHAVVPVSTNGGVNLLLGNSEHVTASSGSAGDIGTYYRTVDHQGLDEVAADRYYTRSALHWMGAHPAAAFRLYLGKLARSLAFHDPLQTDGLGSALDDVLSALSCYPVLALVLIRLLRTRRQPLRDTEKLLLALAITNVLVLAAYFIRIRLRLPVDALLIILAATSLLDLLRTSPRTLLCVKKTATARPSGKDTVTHSRLGPAVTRRGVS